MRERRRWRATSATGHAQRTLMLANADRGDAPRANICYRPTPQSTSATHNRAPLATPNAFPHALNRKTPCARLFQGPSAARVGQLVLPRGIGTRPLAPRRSNRFFNGPLAARVTQADIVRSPWVDVATRCGKGRTTSWRSRHRVSLCSAVGSSAWRLAHTLAFSVVGMTLGHAASPTHRPWLCTAPALIYTHSLYGYRKPKGRDLDMLRVLTSCYPKRPQTC